MNPTSCWLASCRFVRFVSIRVPAFPINEEGTRVLNLRAFVPLAFVPVTIAHCPAGLVAGASAGVMPRSSTSKMSVAFGGISGGEPFTP